MQDQEKTVYIPHYKVNMFYSKTLLKAIAAIYDVKNKHECCQGAFVRFVFTKNVTPRVDRISLECSVSMYVRTYHLLVLSRESHHISHYYGTLRTVPYYIW